MPEVLALSRQNQCIRPNQLVPHSPLIQCTRKNHLLISPQFGRQLPATRLIRHILPRPHQHQFTRNTQPPQRFNRQMHVLDRMNPAHQNQFQHTIVRRTLGQRIQRPLGNIRHQHHASPRELLLHLLNFLR